MTAGLDDVLAGIVVAAVGVLIYIIAKEYLVK